MCDDFIWDPTLEDLRNRKIGTGTFSSMQTHPLPPKVLSTVPTNVL